MVLKRGALVDEPVALLRGEIAAPVRDLEVALQESGVRDGAGVFVAHAHKLFCACGHIVEGPVGEGRALLLGVRLAFGIEVGREGGVVGDIAIGELDLCLLLLGCVGGGCVCAEGVLQVLLGRLGELGGDGDKGREDRVRDAERLLGVGCKRLGEVDEVELCRAGALLDL